MSSRSVWLSVDGGLTLFATVDHGVLAEPRCVARCRHSNRPVSDLTKRRTCSRILDRDRLAADAPFAADERR
jgi:hypothetical protein